MSKISVITASYNYENYIKDTIESVLSQSYSDFELIVVDDGSSDSSIEVINSYVERDSRVKLFTHENNENKGLIETLKLALEKAEGEFVAFLESDDLFEPDNLMEKAKILEQSPDVDLIFNDVLTFGAEDIVSNYSNLLDRHKKLIKTPNVRLSELVYDNIIPTFSCVLVRKSVIKNCDFDAKIQPCVDWFLWSQIIKDSKCVFIDKKLSKWRMHDNSYIKTLKAHKHSMQKNQLEMILKAIEPPKIPNLITDFLLFINSDKIEKLFRPQVKSLTKFLVSLYNKNVVKIQVIK